MGAIILPRVNAAFPSSRKQKHVFILLTAILACSKKEDGGGDLAPAPPAPTKGDFAAARGVLEKFLAPSADAKALTKDFEPTSGDYAAVFGPDAPKAEAHYSKSWSDSSILIAPRTGQTELILWSASSDDIAMNPAVKNFPNGYEKAHLARGLMVYRWKFVEQGQTLGTAFDGLVFVNGHFAFFPAPWRVTE